MTTPRSSSATRRIRGWLALVVLGLMADRAPGQSTTLSTERLHFLAQVQAEPQRIKEIIDEHGGDWCGMLSQTRLRNPRRLQGAGRCPIEGPADLVANRDACIPGPNTP